MSAGVIGSEGQGCKSGSKMLRWLRRRRTGTERRRTFTPAEPSPDIDPIDELRRILGEPHDDSDNRGLRRVDEPRDQGGSIRVQQSALRQLFRPRRSLPVVRARTPPPREHLHRQRFGATAACRFPSTVAGLVRTIMA